MLQPELPRVLRNAFVYPFPQFPLPGDAIQSRQLFSKFDAVHRARAGFYRLTVSRCWTARFIRHASLLSCVLPSHLTANSRKFLAVRSPRISWPPATTRNTIAFGRLAQSSEGLLLVNITTLFWDIGGVILTNGWDRGSRKEAAVAFHLDWDE